MAKRGLRIYNRLAQMSTGNRSMKIIVETEEQKQELIRQSQYIHDFLINKGDIKGLGKDWLIGLDSDKAGTLMHIYMAPQIIEVEQKITQE
jgi:hypothetical protein